MVTKILGTRGNTKPLGKQWVDKFFRKHTQIKDMIGKSIDHLRVGDLSQEAIN